MKSMIDMNNMINKKSTNVQTIMINTIKKINLRNMKKLLKKKSIRKENMILIRQMIDNSDMKISKKNKKYLHALITLWNIKEKNINLTQILISYQMKN